MTANTPAVRPLTLAMASTIVDGVLALGASYGYKPLAAAVLDAAGCLIAFKRQDQDALLRGDIAIGKAWCAVGAGMASREVLKRAQANPHFYASMTAMADGRMIVGIGGVLVRDATGSVIGAVGVSGDLADNDERCAIEAIKQAGLVPDAGNK